MWVLQGSANFGFGTLATSIVARIPVAAGDDSGMG
jgi:hypothetical protein